MRKQINRIWHRMLVFLHLSPLSLAAKCRLSFGAAVVFVLALALLIPYIWMGQLAKKSLLDTGKAKSEVLQNRHFQARVAEGGLVRLNGTGLPADVNDPALVWIRFGGGQEQLLTKLDHEERELVAALRADEETEHRLLVATRDSDQSLYVRIVRANEGCISCHNPQGSASAFSRNEAIGAVLVRQSASELGKTIDAFYVITQRVILRPIRQLRALANNVAEGNLDIRSAIKTRDEYERLADSFNGMLDALQASQEKLRKTNRQLDEKIAELSERNIELFKANKIKGEFLANISHEFRTPLNAILGFAELLREKAGGPNKEKNERYAENIVAGGKRLLNMINDLLDLAKTEAGKMTLHVEPTSLAELCKGLAASFSLLTRDKKIKVRLSIDEDIPTLVTDGGKVQQILYNFVSNAVKFTEPRGRIEIRANMTDDRHVRIAVTDTGCGIAPSDKEKIFEKFRQADGSLTRGSTGSGLGLAISKELASMLAGSIGLESELGKGSTFWLEIPITLSSEGREVQTPSATEG
jgi:two-component system sensor histidine kinase BarA